MILFGPSIVIFVKKTEVTTLPMTDAKLYVPVVTLSTKDNVKLLQQLISGFGKTINWKKYLSKAKILQKSNI